MSDPLAELFAMESCGCRVCIDEVGETPTFYVLCPKCGCKRCPRATNHAHECTGSNKSGQVGSWYGTPCLRDCCTAYNARRERDELQWQLLYGGEVS